MTTSANLTLAEPPDEVAANPQPASKPLGTRLLEAGLISEAQLDLALREQRRQGKLLGEVLVELGFVSAEVITSSVASEARTDVVDVLRTVIDDDVLKLV